MNPNAKCGRTALVCFASLLLGLLPTGALSQDQDPEMDPAEAQAWESAGFQAMRALEWKRDGFTPMQAGRWKAAGYDRQEAKQWKENGFSPETARPWRELNYKASPARAWREAGFDPSTARPWETAGYDPSAVLAKWLLDATEEERSGDLHEAPFLVAARRRSSSRPPSENPLHHYPLWPPPRVFLEGYITRIIRHRM